MKYKASLDPTAKIITLLIVLLFAFVGYMDINVLSGSELNTSRIFIYGGNLLLLTPILLVTYILAPKYYIIDNVYLIIVRPIGNKKIDLKDIKQIKILKENQMQNGIRTFGVGGLFGYFGKYKYRDIGNVTLYATQTRNKILIETKQGKKIIITPDDLGIMDNFHHQEYVADGLVQ